MLLRRFLPVALAAAALAACEPSVPKRTNPSTADYVVFDPSTSQIPLPNDLALQQSAIDAQTGAQKELLQSFLAQHGFPNDQEVPVTIDVQRFTLGPGAPTKSAPAEDLDVATLTPLSLLVLEKANAITNPAGLPAAVDLATLEKSYGPNALGDRATLTLRRKADATTKSRRWNAGSQYIVVVRGGASGLKLTGGGELLAMPTMYLLTRGVDLSAPENEYLLPGAGRQGRAAAGAQLEQLRQSYLTIFGAAEQAWGAGATQDILSVQTFQIAPSAGDAVVVDAGSGVVPLPSDFLLDPATGKVANNPTAFGPLATGLASLDGFSTTAMHLISTLAPVKASTVTGDTVLLYAVGATGFTRVPTLAPTNPGDGAAAKYLTQPPPINGCPAPVPAELRADCALTMGLQPATSVPVGPSTLFLPPLEEATQYAVLVTNGVQDVSGNPLIRNSFTKLLFFQNPLADLTTSKSLVSALTDAQAVAFETLRTTLLPGLLAKANADKGVTADQVVMAYTVKTQSITGTALSLAAAPYANPAAFVPGTPVDVTSVLPPQAAAQEVLFVPIPTLDPINVQTGAFEPDNTKWTPATLPAIVVVPQTTPTFPGVTLPSCPAPAAALKCAPLVVFQHGITRSKIDVMAVANTLASAGFVVAAIDSPLHGDRAYCTQDADCTCAEFGAATSCGAKCDFFGPAGLQGDTSQIGRCGSGSVAKASVSARFLVTQNFFRTRDALRQIVLDQSALVLALAPPSAPSNPLATELASKGIAIDASKVYSLGVSLGGITNVLSVASNPRFSRAVLNVPGATAVDIFTNSPSLDAQVTALFASLNPPVVKGSPAYLQLLQVLKWIIDPGDPANFAGHLTGDTLPNLLATPQASQAAKSVFGQYAECDQTIPNAFNLYLFGAAGLAHNSGPNGFTKYTITNAPTPPACTATSVNPHGFLLDPTADPTTTADGQTDAAAYLVNLTVPSTDR